MNPLFEMLTNLQAPGQQNSIQEQMARQFGLQQDQAAKAIEALMPAFSQGLKRNAAATPSGLAAFMQALATGNHANYLQNPTQAFTPKGMNEGKAILGHLFGNKEISRAVAAQAEATSGVSQAILKQMLPALAPLVMGGLFKQMTGQTQAAAQTQAQSAMGGGGILGQILEEMMKGGLGGGMGGGQPRSPQSQPRARNPLEEILEQMTGGRTAPGGGQTTNSGGGSLGDIFNDMLKGGTGVGNQRPVDPYEPPAQERNSPYGQEAAPEPDEPEPSGYPKGTGLEDLFGDLFKPTRQGAPKYDKAIESIFDQFMKPRS